MVHIRNWSRWKPGSTLLRTLYGLTALVAATALAPADASAETRTLKLHFVHTGEKVTATFKKNGRYVDSGLRQINQVLRDFRRNEPTKMDPRLLDLVWEVYQQSGSRDYIHVISAYRSPATNNMLRSRGRGVAKNSQHTLGKAMDFFLPDVKLSKLREIGLRMGVGGVGFYPTSGSPFVHLDTGNVRHWPKMSRQELARIFPDGKTLHVPSDGKPLPRYEQALAEYKAKGRTSAVTVASAEETKKPNFFQLLAQRAREDQADDEGALEAVPGVYAGASSRPAEVTVARAAPQPAAPAAPAPAVPVPAAPLPAAEIPVPQAPVARPEIEAPAQIAALPEPVAEPAAETLALARVPLPQRRPQYAPVIAAVPAPQPAAAPVEVAALTPDEIEEIRRIATPTARPAEARVALPQVAAAPVAPPRPAVEVGTPQPAPAIADTKLALVSPSGPAASGNPSALAAERLAAGAPVPARSPAADAAKPARETVTASVPARPAGPSGKTLELALAASGEQASDASRAIRSLIEASGQQPVPGGIAASFSTRDGAVAVAGAPVPIPNPRKAAGQAVLASAAPAAAAPAARTAQVAAKPAEKVGRYALAANSGLEKIAEIRAPGYSLSPSGGKPIVVAGFVRNAPLQAQRKFDANAPATLPGIRFETQ